MSKINTGDNLEIFSEEMSKIKEKYKRTSFLKGGNDDMYNFTKTFSDIAQNMKMLDGISMIVQDVADGAMHQAEETEKSVNIIGANMDALNKIAEEDQKRDQLEGAVNNIQFCIRRNTKSCEMILSVKDKFSC